MAYITKRHEEMFIEGQTVVKDSVLSRKKARKGEDVPDDFIMVYVRMIGAINRIPPTANPILNALLRRVSPAHNGQAIILNSSEIQNILQECNIKKTAFYENMRMLVEYQVLFPSYTDKEKTKWSFCSTFYLNPYMFGFGNWTDIKNLRSKIELNEQGLTLLTETSNENSMTSLKPGEQQRLFRIEGDYFGVADRKKAELRQNEVERLKEAFNQYEEEPVIDTVLEQVREADEAHRAESSSADQSEADSEFEILDDVSLKPKSFINGLGSTVVQAFGAEWKGKVLQFKNREQRDAFLRSRKK